MKVTEVSADYIVIKNSKFAIASSKGTKSSLPSERELFPMFPIKCIGKQKHTSKKHFPDKLLYASYQGIDGQYYLIKFMLMYSYSPRAIKHFSLAG